MLRLFRVLLIVSLLVGLAPALPAAAQQALPPDCKLSPGSNSVELYLICLPWPADNPPPKFDLVVFAHGYVPPNETSMTKYIEQMLLSDGTFLPSLVNSMGYAFASTSYTKNGLAVREGLADTERLIQTFETQYLGRVRYVYLVGASEGGLITTLAAEQQSSPISGGLALCGPIGSFRGQINYWGDFRVLFDYFYPHQLPGIPIKIPARLMSAWDSVYVPQIAGLIGNPDNQLTTAQLLSTSRAPFDAADPFSVISTTVGILSYNVFATNEAQVELGGQPFDNKDRWYTGSADDAALNKPGGVQRFAADPAALQEIGRYYETSGELKAPLVTMHTLGDPIVPYWHELLYGYKVLSGGSASKYHEMLPIVRYGHCTFTTQEALAGFGYLRYMVTGELPASLPQGLAPTAQ